MDIDGIIGKFGEVFLKGKNRHRFADRMLMTVRHKLRGFEGVVCTRSNDHIDIVLHGADPDAVGEQLKYVFGFQSFQPYLQCETELEALKQTTLKVVQSLEGQDKSIKVMVKRSDKQFPMKSPELAQELGHYVRDHSSVPLHLGNPDVKIKVMVRRGKSFVAARELPAPGGLPIGVNGKAMLMLSGGLDSPVAGYLMMKRGLAIEGLHFESPPYTSPRARQKVYDLAEKLAHYMPNDKLVLHVVPFTALQKAIFEHVPESYGMTVMRRMMYRVCEGVARRRGAELAANGESLGQVASQTPASMAAINCVTDMPVIRPVACMDKCEIVAIARQIDTFETSIRPFEDCCTVFLPKSPATAPKREKCERFEAAFDWEPLVQACVEDTARVIIEAGHPVRIDEDTSEEICALL